MGWMEEITMRRERSSFEEEIRAVLEAARAESHEPAQEKRASAIPTSEVGDELRSLASRLRKTASQEATAPMPAAPTLKIANAELHTARALFSLRQLERELGIRS